MQHDGAAERVDAAVFALVPEFARASLRLVGVHPGRRDGVRAFLKAVSARAKTAGASSQPPRRGAAPPGLSPVSWRDAYARVGLPADTMPPPEALGAWAESPGGVPSTGTVTDLVNAFSLAHGVPTAAYDLTDAQGGLWLRPARGHETWLDPSGPDADSPPINELILADGADRVVARQWHGSPGRMFQERPTSSTVQVHVDVLTWDDPEARAGELADEFGRLATAYFGCTVAALILCRGRMRVRWPAP